MKLLTTLLTLILLSLSLFADSDGEFTYTENILVYEEHLSHPDQLFFIYFGENDEISEKIKLKLPVKINSNIYEMHIEKNKLSVAFIETNKEAQIVNYINVDLSQKKAPKVISHEKKFYKKNTKFKDLKLKRTKGNLGFWSVNKTIDLKSTSKKFSYKLVISSKEINKKNKESIEENQHQTTLKQFDKEGKLIKEKTIFRKVHETVLEGEIIVSEKAVSLNSKYGIAGVKDDSLIEKSAKSFCDYVKSGNKEKVSEMISYPIKVKIMKKRVKITNKKEFIKLYSKIFTDDYKKKIADSKVNDMFANSSGVMLGRIGEVWFNYKGLVIALNR